MLKLMAPEPSRHPSPTTKAAALTHLVWGRPSLDLAERFLTDFGLVVSDRRPEALYLRGSRPTPYCYRVEHRTTPGFIGLGLRVPERCDLEALAALPGASPIQPAAHPGGGEVVVLTDPSGFVVEAIWGQAPADAQQHRAALVPNTGDDAPRVDATQRTPVAPPQVLQLGHVVLEAAAFQDTCAFYTRHFGFIPSDIQLLPDGSPAVVFLRLSLGDVPADHHTLALAQGVLPQLGHAAFEVVDTDAVGMGQRVLREAGWRHAWGIGRHILGSQIFDYWQDPWGDKHEHYTDGDKFTESVPVGIHPVSREAMAQWGPPMPRDFTKPRLSLASLAAITRSVRSSPDLSVQKLITLARIFG